MFTGKFCPKCGYGVDGFLNSGEYCPHCGKKMEYKQQRYSSRIIPHSSVGLYDNRIDYPYRSSPYIGQQQINNGEYNQYRKERDSSILDSIGGAISTLIYYFFILVLIIIVLIILTAIF